MGSTGRIPSDIHTMHHTKHSVEVANKPAAGSGRERATGAWFEATWPGFFPFTLCHAQA